MPAAPPPFPFGAGEVRFGSAGQIESATARPAGPAYVVGGGLVEASIAGRPISWSPPTMTVDVDELELRAGSDSDVSHTLRHSFAVGWGVRLVLENWGAAPVALDAQLGWVVAPSCPAFALPASATGGYAVLPDDVGDPLLGGVLTRGSLVWVDPEWLGLGRIELPALGRYVVQWQWDWYPSPHRFERGRFPSVPRQLVLRSAEVARIAAGDDEAVVARGADVTRVAGELELTVTAPSRIPVRVSSALGVTAYDLTWVASTEDVLVELGAALVPGRLTDVDAALVVQHVLALAQIDDPEGVQDALDRFTGRLLESSSAPDPREIGYLCAEFERTGEAEVLDAATTGLLDLTPVQGVGLAATQVCVARMVAGRPVDAVLGHLARLAAVGAPGSRLTDLAVRLELLAVGPRSGSPADASIKAELDALLDRVGLRLGAGLRGRPVRSLPVDDLAHLSVVLGLLPEELGATARRAWGMGPHALARKIETDVVARLAGERPRAAYGWLVLGTRLR